MTDTLKLKNGLIMPSNFIEVKDDEMEYVDGGLAWNMWAAIGCFVGALVCATVSIWVPVTAARTVALAAKLCATGAAVLGCTGSILACL